MFFVLLILGLIVDCRFITSILVYHTGDCGCLVCVLGVHSLLMVARHPNPLPSTQIQNIKGTAFTMIGLKQDVICYTKAIFRPTLAPSSILKKPVQQRRGAPTQRAPSKKKGHPAEKLNLAQLLLTTAPHHSVRQWVGPSNMSKHILVDYFVM